MPLSISQIFLYPVKSLRGIAVPEASVDPMGFALDRRFLVVDPSGGFLSQRSVPRMATVATALLGHELVLSAEGAGSVRVPWTLPPGMHPVIRPVTVWQSSNLAAEDCGDEAAAWLSAALQTPARLVRAGAAFRRPMPERKLPPALRQRPDPAPDDESARAVSFPDAYPFMLLGEATLAELNSRLQGEGHRPLPIQRFRPSFVVSGGEPFAEDRWRRFNVGSVAFHGGGPCARCIMTNTDPWSGERGVEPLRLLATYRRDASAPSKVNFGQNALHAGPGGTIRLQDPVQVLESEA